MPVEVISLAKYQHKIKFYDQSHHTSDEQLSIGMATSILLAKMEDEVL